MSSPLKLFPFQKECIEKLERVKSVLIGDDMRPGPRKDYRGNCVGS